MVVPGMVSGLIPPLQLANSPLRALPDQIAVVEPCPRSRPIFPPIGLDAGRSVSPNQKTRFQTGRTLRAVGNAVRPQHANEPVLPGVRDRLRLRWIRCEKRTRRRYGHLIGPAPRGPYLWMFTLQVSLISCYWSRLSWVGQTPLNDVKQVLLGL